MPNKRQKLRRWSAFWASVAVACFVTALADPLVGVIGVIPAFVSFVYLMKSEMA